MLKALVNKLKIKKVFLIVVAFLLVVESFFVYLTVKSYGNKTVEKIETRENDRNKFDIYVQNEINGKYEKYIGSNLVPSDTNLVFNEEKSYCEDYNGVKKDGALTYNANGSFTLTSDVSAYCHIYFTRIASASNLSEKLINDGVMWQSGLEGDGYRFTGSGAATASTSPDNFICFGTTSKTECKNNEGKYLYRIIGVFKDTNNNDSVKLIKYKQLGGKVWHSNDTIEVSWENSELYNGLNGNYFLKNSAYNYMQNADWLNRIANWKWSAVNARSVNDNGIHYRTITAQQIYLHEMDRTSKTYTIGNWTTPIAKIGLMYVSDYAMSLGASSFNYISDSNAAIQKTGWMHQNNNDITTSQYEWTMSRYCFEALNYVYEINIDGIIYGDGSHYAFGVRPVFYLKSSVIYASGTGDYTDPIIIN